MLEELKDRVLTGFKEIDEQHFELFRRTDAFYKACMEGKGRQEVKVLMEYLENYVNTHFSMEEKYMEMFKYPDFISHSMNHNQFRTIFNEIKAEFEKKGENVKTIVNTNKEVTYWWLTHIKHADVDLALFLSKKSEKYM